MENKIETIKLCKLNEDGTQTVLEEFIYENEKDYHGTDEEIFDTLNNLF